MVIMHLTDIQSRQITPAAQTRADRYEGQRIGQWQSRNYGSDKYSYTKEQFYEQQFKAIAAEMLVAQYLNVPFDASNDNFKNLADVAGNVEVKHTTHNNGRLPIWTCDRVQDLSVLVVSTGNTYTLRGFYPVALARESAGLTESDGTIWIQQKHLANMAFLGKLVIYAI